MRSLLAAVAVLAIFATPVVAHADVINYSIAGTLNTFSGSAGPGTATQSNSVGSVSGTFSFDNVSDKFTSVDLIYIYTPTNTTYTVNNVASTAPSYNGNDFYIAFNTDVNGVQAALELTPGLALCTLDAPCPGTNASNLEVGTYPNIGEAVVTATPEPSSLVLLGTGILSAAGFARRKFLKA